MAPINQLIVGNFRASGEPIEGAEAWEKLHEF